mgnify:CR=1 FL=1
MNQVSVIATGLWAKVQTGQFIAAGESENIQPAAELSDATAKVINGLFRELRSIFPAWKQAWPDMATYKAAKQQWAAAHREACLNSHPSMADQAKWSHDAVWHTAKECGFENLNRLPHDLSIKLFERNYTITVRRVLAGLPLQKMPLALPARAIERSSPEVGNKALAALRALRSRGSAYA